MFNTLKGFGHMPKVNDDYEKKTAYIGLKFTERENKIIERAVKKSKKTKQGALGPLIMRWAEHSNARAK